MMQKNNKNKKPGTLKVDNFKEIVSGVIAIMNGLYISRHHPKTKIMCGQLYSSKSFLGVCVVGQPIVTRPTPYFDWQMKILVRLLFRASHGFI
jgi:hypothetical protein